MHGQPPFMLKAFCFATCTLTALAAGAPVAQPDAISMHTGQKAAIAVLANDTGTIDAGTVTVVQAPQFGTAVPTATGRVLYTHTTGAPSTDTFTYHVSGGGGTSADATVTIHFSPTLRIPAPALNVPGAPPATAYRLDPAFGSLVFSQPVGLATPPGDVQRLFVCEKAGLLKVIPDVSAQPATASTVLDLPNAVLAPRSEVLHSGGECGLLSVAFHPNFATNRQFFIFYSVFKGGVLYERVSRFLMQEGNANAADITSERILIEQRDEASNHNGGDLHFGPDGLLYISLGDEGNQNDSFNNSQHIDKDFFSSILRIDVDRASGLEPNAHPNPTAGTGSDPAVNAVPRYETAPGSGVFRAAYTIPADNPLVGATTFNGQPVQAANVRSEIWATGLRNPWRFSFDPLTGKLWCGDVGGDQREEVNIIVKGGNYGWAYREGTIAGPKSGTAVGNLPPLYEYTHGGGSMQGNSITGGFVYRGGRFSGIQGRYVFSDHVSGNIWSMQQDGSDVQRIAGEGGIAAFAPDPSNGDVLMADYDSNTIRRLVQDSSGVVDTFPQQLSETGLFADLTDLSPNPGVLPYSVNLPFWSDHAQKRRWFTIPDTVGRMTWSRDGVWTFPAGQIWVKHFDLPLTRSDPPSASDPLTPAKRIETRLLVKTATGVYGVSYRWNDAGTEATLAPDAGADFDIPLTQNGAPYTQHWHIPSRAECLVCHTPQAGYALSSNTRQLNLAGAMNGFGGNQIDLLRSAGYFTNTTESPNVLPRYLRPEETAFPVEARVRSFLAVNCAYCHKMGGTAGTATWDGRPEITLEQTGLIHGVATNNGGNAANQLVVPGDTLHSIVLNRVAVANGFTRMPPIASNELDQRSVSLLTEWINSTALINRQTYADWRLAQFGSSSSPQGDPSFDADGDGHSNREEFLAQTDPHNGALFFQPRLAPGGPGLTLGFTIPPNRSWQIEASPDLATWSLWNVPGNQGLPSAGGPVSITVPLLDTKQFFRLRLWEN
jgi:uncharacterized repeat protein (TIGR03806 family)